MPGVPPDAANIVKRVFKGIFKRGKSKKQDGASTTPGGDSSSTPPPNQSSSVPAASTSPTPQVDTKPPQLPPIGNASPLQSATESSSMKAVPPTHPLGTGEHEKPQEAVAVDKSADPAPGPPLGGGSNGAATTGGLKEPEKLGVGSAVAAGGSSGPGDVSPPVSTVDAVDAPKSGAVSAISKEDAPKASTEAVADGVVGDSGKTAQSIPVEPSTQAPATGVAATSTTDTPDATPAASKENVPPQVNGTSSAETSTDAPVAPPTTDSTPAAAPSSTTDSTKPTTITDTTTTDTAKTGPSDEKMPATMEEPPPIKTVRAAPGMSATSGPLEDFPEGGDAKD